MFLSSLGGTHTVGRLFGNTSLGYVSSICEGKTDRNPPPKKNTLVALAILLGLQAYWG